MAAGITEAEFTAQVAQLAKMLGWRVAHFRPARTTKGWRTPCQFDAKGFPDLLLLRGHRMIVAELKRSQREAAKITQEQKEWLAAFAQVPQYVYVVVWTPDDWLDIERILKGDGL